MMLGYGALGSDGFVTSGSRRLKGDSQENIGKAGRHCDAIVRELILEVRPTMLAFATPFVGIIPRKVQVINGQKVWSKFKGVPPNAIRPLFGFLMVIDMIADELSIACTEVSEQNARRAFLHRLPGRSKDIKSAVMHGCRLRGWQFPDNHAADALCVASHVMDQLMPRRAFERTPMFSTRNLP
jgi:hypothetical protein